MPCLISVCESLFCAHDVIKWASVFRAIDILSLSRSLYIFQEEQ